MRLVTSEADLHPEAQHKLRPGTFQDKNTGQAHRAFLNPVQRTSHGSLLLAGVTTLMDGD